MNITKLSEKYVQERPYIKKGLSEGLINYSALTRKILKENKLDLKKNFDAISIALRRYKGKVKKAKGKDYSSLLKKAKMEFKNKVKGNNVEVILKLEKDISSLAGYVFFLLDENEIKFNGENSFNEVKIVISERDLGKVVGLFT